VSVVTVQTVQSLENTGFRRPNLAPMASVRSADMSRALFIIATYSSPSQEGH